MRQRTRAGLWRGLAAAVAAGGACWLSGCATTPADAYFLSSDSSANVYVAGGAGTIRKVAVMPFKAPTELVGASVSDLFVTEALRTDRYELVERGQMAAVLGETELALAGVSEAKAIEVGNMMGADGVILGTVDEYATVAHRGRTYPSVGISARLIECQTGKILWSVNLARRADDPRTTLAEHGRGVVHEMVAGLYRKLRAR